MSKTVTTKNKYEVVYYMSYGFTIHSITFQKKNDRIIPEFTITGQGLEEMSSRYKLGRAIISLVELEENLEKLEELIRNEYELFYEGDNEDGK